MTNAIKSSIKRYDLRQHKGSFGRVTQRSFCSSRPFPDRATRRIRLSLISLAVPLEAWHCPQKFNVTRKFYTALANQSPMPPSIWSSSTQSTRPPSAPQSTHNCTISNPRRPKCLGPNACVHLLLGQHRQSISRIKSSFV